jgi:hypothetical protein
LNKSRKLSSLNEKPGIYQTEEEAQRTIDNSAEENDEAGRRVKVVRRYYLETFSHVPPQESTKTK